MALSRGRESPKRKEEIGVSLSTQLKDHAGREGGEGAGNFRFRENSVGKGGGGADSLIFGVSSYSSGFDKCSRERKKTCFCEANFGLFGISAEGGEVIGERVCKQPWK